MSHRSLMSRRTWIASASATCAASVFPGVAGGAQTRVRMAQALDAVDFLPMYVARDKGFFTAEGIDLELTLTGGSGPDVAALLARNVDFVATAPQPMFNAAAEGQKVVGIFNLAKHTSVQMMINNDWAAKVGFDSGWDLKKRLASLKGAKIGISRPGALTDSLARHYVEAAGLKVGSDVQIVAVGVGPAMMAALEQGHVEYIMGYSPIAEQQLVTKKAQMFIDVAKGEDPAIKELLGELLVTRPDVIEQQPDVVKRVVVALLRSNKWVNEASDDEVAAVVAKYFPSLDPRALRLTAAHQRTVTPADGKITRLGVDTAKQMHVTSGGKPDIPPFEQLFTNRFVE
jgi:NitT/TauT family transport system substrate-binding protein